MSERVVNILGVGNPLMRDDGVGVAAVEQLARRDTPSWLRAIDAGLAVSDVLGTLDPADPLIIIDAFRAGGPPGSIYQADLAEVELWEDKLVGCMSLHEISVVPALRIESLTGREFRDVTVFGVEPGDVAWGEGLSPPVTANLAKLIEAVLARAREAATQCTAVGDTQL